MTASLSIIAGKDGTGTTISGGIQALDLSGAGTGPWSFANIIVDGTSGSNRAAVKAASTAPVATDPALVVSISPNSVNANGQTTLSGSAPVAIASNQTTLAVAQDTTQLMNGVTGTGLNQSRATMTAATSGATTLVNLVSGKRIRVLGAFLTANGAVNVNLQSHTTTSNKTGLIYCAAAGDGMVMPFNPLGWFDTTSGEALDINLSGAVAVDGYLLYVSL